MTAVLDASALLAFLQDEPGADDVERALIDGAVVGAANFSEVAQKVLARGADWEISAAVLDSYDLLVEPVTRGDAERAARRWKRGSGLSLADRLCLALADRLQATAFTADAAWGSGEGIHQIRARQEHHEEES